MTEFAVRRATAGDLDALVDLALALQAHLEKRNPAIWRLTPEGRASMRGELAQILADSDWLVLTACGPGGNAIGMAEGHALHQDRHEPHQVGVIGRTFVQEGWRRQGVGRALVNGLAAFFRERGIDEIAVSYVIGNREAERFWTGLGFEPRIIRAGTSLMLLDARLAADASRQAAATRGFEEEHMLETILARRSIRHYTPEPVSRENVVTLLEAAMAAPSASNRRPWHFVIVTDRTKLDAMGEALPYGKMLFGAPLAIAVCGDPALSANHWVQDCSAATENILLAATSLGLGAVWLGVEPNLERAEAVAKILGIPSTMGVLNVISVGHPAEAKEPRTQFDDARIHYEAW